MSYRYDRIRTEKKPSIPSYKVPKWATSSKEYPSVSGKCNTELKERLQYTGTYVKGIATMHKSNTVPITDDKQILDISRMRR